MFCLAFFFQRVSNTSMKTTDEKLVEALKKMLARPGISKGLRRLINRVLAD